jgi:hypothetical protein
VRRITDPTYAFVGSPREVRTYPRAVVYTASDLMYNSTGQQYVTPMISSYPAVAATAVRLFILENTTEPGTGHQRVVFTLSKCIAIDGNPAGFCDSLRTSTSPLFLACVAVAADPQGHVLCAARRAPPHVHCRR